MQELRLVAVSEDGSYAVLAVPGRGGRFSLPIDDRLRIVARGQFSRLAQYEIEVESPLRPKEIQDRIRAGETADEIADAAGVPIERVRRFEGPVLAERAYRAQEAQRATIRQPGDSGPGPWLGDMVAERLVTFGSSPEEALWDSRKRADGNWEVQLMFTAGGRPHMAEWVFDPRRRHVTPADDDAARLSLPEDDLPAPQRGPSAAPRATVTPIATRLAPLGPPAAVAAPGPRAQPEPEEERRHAHAAAQAGASRDAPPRSASREAQTRADGREAQARAGSREAQTRADGRDMPQQDSIGRETAVEEDSAAQSPPPARERPVRKAAGGRSRRSSVPSWDEIMFGNSRQPD
jgi:hypothetical protein